MKEAVKRDVERLAMKRGQPLFLSVFSALLVLLALTKAPSSHAAPNKGGPPRQSNTEFQDQVQEQLPGVLEKFKQGDELAFWPLWDSLNQPGLPQQWVTVQRRNLVAVVEDLRIAEQAGLTARRWSAVYESLIQRTHPEGIREIGSFNKLAPAHALQAIEQDRGDQVFAWFQGLPPEKQDLYFYALKDRNRFLIQLQKRVNPFQADPNTLNDEPRLTLVEKFLAHPFFRRIQPFNNRTFEQLLKLKCLSPDELFAHREKMVSAHVRQGMAYVDLARIYRDAGHFDKALDQIEIGLTLHNHQGNRLGIYLIERTIIYRGAGKMKEARETFETIPFDLLDRSSTRLVEEVEKTL